MIGIEIRPSKKPDCKYRRHYGFKLAELCKILNKSTVTIIKYHRLGKIKEILHQRFRNEITGSI